MVLVEHHRLFLKESREKLYLGIMGYTNILTGIIFIQLKLFMITP